MIHDGGGGFAGQLCPKSEKKNKKKNLRKCIFRAGQFAALSLFKLGKCFFLGNGYVFTHFTNFIQRPQK